MYSRSGRGRWRQWWRVNWRSVWRISTAVRVRLKIRLCVSHHCKISVRTFLSVFISGGLALVFFSSHLCVRSVCLSSAVALSGDLNCEGLRELVDLVRSDKLGKLAEYDQACRGCRGQEKDESSDGSFFWVFWIFSMNRSSGTGSFERVSPWKETRGDCCSQETNQTWSVQARLFQKLFCFCVSVFHCDAIKEIVYLKITMLSSFTHFRGNLNLHELLSSA